MTDADNADSTEDSENRRNDRQDDIHSPPPQTSDREYGEEKEPPSSLLPMSPRERELMNGFKKIIAQHLENVGEKTTSEFLEGVALELWRLTRKQ